jgi:hypothetical protein
VDGTLCSQVDGDYERAEPYKDMIARINALYDAGHRIVLYTARGSTTGKDWRGVTERQMRDWGVKHHELLLGKPYADVYIDDKAINAKDWLKSA